VSIKDTLYLLFETVEGDVSAAVGRVKFSFFSVRCHPACPLCQL